MKKTVRVVIAIFIVLLWLMRLWNETSITPKPEEEIMYQPVEEPCEEFMNDSLLLESEPARIIQRSWSAYQYTERYCARYGAKQKAQEEAASFRENLRLYYRGNYLGFWNNLYNSLYQHDADKLIVLQDSLNRIASMRNLNRIDFASFVVSFVQDIPYEFVSQEACTGNEQNPCNGNVLYGLYSPAEFVYQLKGDCDTRTVLLYTLFKNFGYEVAILISREYEHSMLGIDLPVAGDYITSNGRNYYFWETTNVGWMPGVLPPDMNNTNYWKVALN